MHAAIVGVMDSGTRMNETDTLGIIVKVGEAVFGGAVGGGVEALLLHGGPRGHLRNWGLLIH